MHRKKMVSLLLSVVMVLVAVPFKANAANVVGDVNADHSISIGDVARLYAHFQGNSLVGQDVMDRADLKRVGWLDTDYVRQLYDRARDFSLEKLLRVVEQLPEETIHLDTVTLKGRVVMIREAYHPEYDNITAVVEVSDTGERILCYRMTGEGMERLCVNDSIEVTGQLQRLDRFFESHYYNKSVGFAAGCYGKITTKWAGPNTAYQLAVDRAYSLPVNVSLREEQTLKGTVIAVEPADSSGVSELTVTIQVADRQDQPIRCCGLTGQNLRGIRVGKEITVRGILGRSSGFVGFEGGCVLVGIESSGFYG